MQTFKGLLDILCASDAYMPLAMMQLPRPLCSSRSLLPCPALQECGVEQIMIESEGITEQVSLLLYHWAAGMTTALLLPDCLPC
jgi:hypothetical protein